MQGFAIELRLDSMYRQGLEAIDFCRAWGLPEEAHVHAYGSRKFPITDEPFLRLWFGRSETLQVATVEIDWLLPGELVLSNTVATLSPDLPVDRVKDLFVRARFAKLQADMEKAEKLIAEASSAATEEEEES
jgi:hypothetical protein